MMTEEEKKGYARAIWARFNGNAGSLYTLFESLTEVADEIDRKKVRKFAEVLASLLRDDPQKVENELARFLVPLDELEIYPDIKSDDSIQEAVSLFRDSQFVEEMLEWEKRHPFKSQKFLRAFYTLYQDPPETGLTIRSSMLVMLVTFLEILFQDAIVQARMSDGETKQDALKFANIDGWGKRLRVLQKLGLIAETHAKFETPVIEFTKLRNLLVHNNGVIDQAYLDKAPQKHKNLSPGTRLIVSTRYFQNAIDTVYSFGFFICLGSWKQNGFSDKEQTDIFFPFIITALNQKRYSLVLKLTENIDCFDVSEHTQNILLVNRAIAFREIKNESQVRKIITILANSNPDWQIELAISMLEENFAQVKKQLDILMNKNLENVQSFFGWPLFDPVKEERWFKASVMKIHRKYFPPTRRKKRQ